MRNDSERRLFVSATSQNDGKTSCSIGLMEGLKQYAASVGFIKPVGQRYVVVGHDQVDEDAVLIKRIFELPAAAKDMSPVAIPKNFTREYLDDPERNYPTLLKSLMGSFARVAENNDLIVIEGTGHAGVGSVFDLSNAHVAHMLNAKVLLVTLGGIGQPIDEVALSHCLFERAGVEIIGVIANKVLPEKLEQTRHYMSKALARMGLPLFGAIPYTSRLTWPTVQQIADKMKAKIINGHNNLHNPVGDVVIGAMTPHNALNFIGDRSFLIVPGDRDDLVLAAVSMDLLRDDIDLSGILFTGGILPQPQTVDLLSRTEIPVLLVESPTYEAATRVQKLTVKIQVEDAEKIHLAATMVCKHVNIEGIWKALG